ncbi:hypothetical protein E1B28_010400 [Marasmius oreades]|uniref:Nephrocystin 3-like N-terminal domain-containing protein n=1 Tax=Marasmius oreades TaxID=181124 RepID=A0A9P7RXP0_9AGAR|nr:uncharacterized protein E1B28_010400 [Marasmius oreades]KAG7091358.1 hypothetical protein E1B28_010400 [Marasmius oreades]
MKRSVLLIVRSYSRRSKRRSPSSISEKKPFEGPTEPPTSQDDADPAPTTVLETPRCSNLEAARLILELVNAAADAIPLPGLKVVTGSLLVLLAMRQKAMDNLEIISEFVKSMDRLRQRLNLLKSEEYTDSSIQQQLTLFSKELEKTYLPQIENLIPPRWEFTLKSVSARIKRIIYSREHEKLLISLTTKINEEMNRILLDVTCYTNKATNRIDKQTNRLWDSECLKHLHIAKSALHDSGDRARCSDNTRTHLLKAIDKWAHSNTPLRIFWLGGSQGTGKSTTAFTIVDALGEDPSHNYLGTFFGSRDHTITQTVSTLAYQIGVRVPGFRAQLISNVKKDNDIGEKKLSEQFEKLLVEPLRAQFSHQASPVILIIDGLDECCGREENGTDKLGIFFGALIQCVQAIQSMKVLISCGPISQLEDVLNRHKDIFCTVSLDGDKLVDNDKAIQRFVDNRMPYQYRGDEEVSRALACVARKAKGSFLYATYMLSLLKSSGRKDFLAQVKADDKLEVAEAVHARYERLVVMALEKEPDGNLRRRLYGTLIAIASCFFERVSVQNAAELFQIEPQRLLTFLEEFSTAQLEVKNLESPAHFAHIAFRDFLHQRTASPPSPGVTIPTPHHEVAVHLFQYMRLNLRRNICGLPCHRDFANIEARPDLKSLIYACKRWADHLESGSSQNDNVSESIINSMTFDALQKFVQDSLLYWLEVLCVLQLVDLAVDSLQKAMKWINPDSSSSRNHIHAWLTSMRLAVNACKPVLKDPLQVYETLLSPLRFETAQLATYHSNVKTSVNINAHFRPHRRMIKTGRDVAFVSLSPNGQLMAIGNTSGSLKLWNINAVRLLGELYSGRPETSLEDLQFIACDKVVAILYDTQRKLVEVNAWDCSRPFIAPIRLLEVVVDDITQNSLKLVPSPDQKYAAIVLHGIMHFWKTETLSSRHSHGVSTSRVLALSSRWFISDRALRRVTDGDDIFKFLQPASSGAFSSDESVLAVGTAKGTVLLYRYDGLRHEQIASLSYGTAALSITLSLSRDGTHLAVLGSSEVKIWKMAKPEERITKLNFKFPRFGFQFLPDGSIFKVASLSDRGNMVVDAYHVSTSVSSQIISAAAFSSDGNLIATGSRDGRIMVYAISDRPLRWEDHVHLWSDPRFQKVDHIGFSPDGRFLASTSAIGLTTLRTIVTPKTGLLPVIGSLKHKRLPFSAFSGNSQYLATAYLNNDNGNLYVEMFVIEAGTTSHTFEFSFVRSHAGTPFQSLALSKDGSKCAVASTDSLFLYCHDRRPTGTGDVLRVHPDRIVVIDGPNARSLRFLDDERYITSTAGVFEVRLGVRVKNVDSGRCFVRDDRWIVDRFGKKCCFLPYKCDFQDSHHSKLMLCVAGGSIVFVRVRS